MSNQNWNNTPQTTYQKKLDRVLLKDCKIPIEVDKKLEDKIRYLCSKLPNKEWSGPLYYKVEGSIKDPKNMKIILKDMLLMDIGSSAHTSFEWEGEDVVGFRMEKAEQEPESLDWITGHIHSHNNMSVFFSGEDWSELEDNTANFNYYLSVIVNNKFDLIANLCFIGASTAVYIIKDDNGEDHKLKLNGVENKVLLYYECTTGNEPVILEELPEIDGRLKILEEKVKIKESKTSNGSTGSKTYETPAKSNQFNGPAKDWMEHNDYKGIYKKYPPTEKEKEFLSKKTNENKTQQNLFDEEQDGGLHFKEDKTEVEKFATFVLSLGEEQIFSSIEERLDMWEKSCINLTSITELIKDNIEDWYNEMYPEEDMQTHESYLMFLTDMYVKIITYRHYACSDDFAIAIKEAADEYVELNGIDLSKIYNDASNDNTTTKR